MDMSSDDSSKRPKMDGGDSGGNSRRQGLLAVNDLTYLLEPDLSVAVNITHKNHFFQSTQYTDTQRAVCILNSGADYIDTRDSYLQFNLSTKENGKGYFGAQGSALNLIKTVTISTRSGDEISRIVDCNRLNAMLNSYRFDSQWSESVGQLIGHGSSYIKNAANTETTYCIPLYLLSDFFGYGRLLPSMIMSGLRIEIEWESSARAFVHASATTEAGKDPRFGEIRLPATAGATDKQTAATMFNLETYTIKEPQFVLKSVQLTDATQRALNELSATNGLEIVYTDYERTETQFGTDRGNGPMHVEVRKACSRALQAYARVRVSDVTDLGIRYLKHASNIATRGGNPAVTNLVTAPGYLERNFDSFASEPASHVTSYQWQLGSLYFPQQPVKGDVMTVAKAGYAQTLIAMNKFGPHKTRPLTPLGEFTSRGPSRNKMAPLNPMTQASELSSHVYTTDVLTRTEDENNFQLYDPVMGIAEPGSFISYGQTWAVALERSSLFELAGVPINNSRVLALRMETDTQGAAVARTIDVYLKYVKLARVFLNNVEVEQ